MTKFNIGDKVKTLVEKIEKHASGKVICPKGSIVTICHVEDDFVMVEILDQNNDQQILAYGIDQIELVK